LGDGGDRGGDDGGGRGSEGRMIIANPLYDTAFKKIVSDPEIATAMIETLLETKVVDIALTPTELIKTMTVEDETLKFLRVDYSAIIRDKDGTEQKILIEMQKAKSDEDILRFRKYLAIAGYLPKSNKENPIPVVTVYFLGFKLPQVDTPCLKVARQYINMMNNTVLETKERFVELLTHDSYIVQAQRINIGEKPQTRLENILSVFEQKNFVEKGKNEIIDYIYPIDDTAVKKMVNALHYISTDPEERKELDADVAWENHIYHTTGKVVRQQDELAEKDRTIAEKDRELAEKDRELTEKDRELADTKRREEAAKQQVEAAKQQADETKRKIVHNLHKKGHSTAEIAETTDLSEPEVENILKP
jgi:hypothetical protein